MDHQIALSACLYATLGVALAHDLREHRIPNALIVTGALTALVLHVLGAGVDGAVTALAGAAVGFGLMLPLHVAGGMAAGDVKLMAVAGALLGPGGALDAVAWTFLIGGLVGALLIAARILADARTTAGGGFLLRLSVMRRANAATRLRYPYAVAIASGTGVAVFLA